VAETLIVADLHLSDRNLAVLGLLDVLLARAQGAAALYILGDLFDYWVGDDQPVPGPIAARLEKLAGLPCPVYFQHGNRDFLLGEAMAARCGMKLLPEYFQPQEWAPALLLCHGDSLCTDDLAYQMMRKQLRNPAFQADFLAKPLPVREAIAQDLRSRSRQETSCKAEDIMDVNAQAVESVMKEQAVSVLIHGHTHRPAIHRLADGKIRAVVGDWEACGSLISLEDGVLRLERFDESSSEIMQQVALAV